MGDTDYTVRFSRRARRISLRVLPHGAVEVVVPEGCDEQTVPYFVARHREWISRTRDRFKGASRVAPEQNGPRPARIRLAAVNEDWRVVYDPAAGRLGTHSGAGYLRLPDVGDKATANLLRRWMRGRATEHFHPWLREMAVEHGFSVNKVYTRIQRSRWGSCSARNNISVNANLLFLRPAVVRYLFVHELCHTVHLNHSPEYWRLVAELEPQWKSLDRELSEGYLSIPSWALPFG